VLSGDPELVLADAIEALLTGREPEHGIAPCLAALGVVRPSAVACPAMLPTQINPIE